MSFGSGEFSQETLFDSVLTTPNVVYFASAGDSPGPEYPSVSPNVISAGGTSISRDTTTGDFILESTWQDAGWRSQRSSNHALVSRTDWPDYRRFQSHA